MTYRQFNGRQLVNPHFVAALTFILTTYFIFTFQYMLTYKSNFYLPLLVVFHLLFAMLVWSMIQVILSDPGRVPIYWGFFAEESENKKRRYCLLCHSFKPQRCHHCSSCQRCVLNMDHHCPWISNCVGFHNRKFFMLFLFYIILTLIFCTFNQVPLIISQFIDISESKADICVHTGIRLVGLLSQIIFLVTISMFFKFHVELVLVNSSTLDNLERERNSNVGPNVYDVGSYSNFEQVFGSKAMYWLFPIQNVSGNGVTWPKNNQI